MRLNIKDKGSFLATTIMTTVPGLIDSLHIIESTREMRILTSKSRINNLLLFLKNHSTLQFKSLQDEFGLDLLDFTYSSSNNIKINKNNRFQIIYYLLSIINEARILIKVNLTNLQSLDSVSSLYSSSVWLEREIWDLFGIFFNNHPDLRRILTDYGFEGFPLRKDFPLSGYVEVLYTTELKKITFKPLELTQEYRVFDFVTPWDIRK